MTTKTIDRVFAACLAVLGLHIVRNALAYGYMREATPGPGFFPFWVGVAIVALSLVNVVRSLRGTEVLESQFDAAGLNKALGIVAIVAGFIFVTPWLGMLVASGLIVPAIAFAIQPRWTSRFAAVILALAVAFPIVCHFLFAVYLQVPLVRGVFGL